MKTYQLNPLLSESNNVALAAVGASAATSSLAIAISIMLLKNCKKMYAGISEAKNKEEMIDVINKVYEMDLTLKDCNDPKQRTFLKRLFKQSAAWYQKLNSSEDFDTVKLNILRECKAMIYYGKFMLGLGVVGLGYSGYGLYQTLKH